MTEEPATPRKHKLIEYANGPSLEEINGTVEVPKGKGFWRTLFAYSGPGALVAVGTWTPATGRPVSLGAKTSSTYSCPSS